MNALRVLRSSKGRNHCLQSKGRLQRVPWKHVRHEGNKTQPWGGYSTGNERDMHGLGKKKICIPCFSSLAACNESQRHTILLTNDCSCHFSFKIPIFILHSDPFHPKGLVEQHAHCPLNCNRDFVFGVKRLVVHSWKERPCLRDDSSCRLLICTYEQKRDM